MLKRLLTLAIFGLILTPLALAAVADDCINLKDQVKIDCYQSKIRENRGQQQTLSSAITYLDSKISLTLAQIEKTKTDIAALEEEIATLIVKINRLDINLTDISKLLVSRVGESYKRILFNPSWHLLAVGGLTDYLEQSTYLASAQQNDRKLLLELQNAKDTNEAQKALKEQKQLDLENLQKQLASQNASLLNQKADKANLLRETKNDEKRFQELLTQALAERQAIVAVFSQAVSRLNKGEGQDIEKGKTIGFVGNSGAPDCSTGAHLHYTVLRNGSPQDPAQLLRDISPGWSNSPDGPFGFSGDWDWSISNPTITQGYGMTYYARLGWYGGNIHDGIDMTGNSIITAQKSGKMILGSTTCDSSRVPGVSTLKYAAVKHSDDPSIITLYLHIQ